MLGAMILARSLLVSSLAVNPGPQQSLDADAQQPDADFASIAAFRITADQSNALATHITLQPGAFAALQEADTITLDDFPLDAQTHVDLELTQFNVISPHAQLILATDEGEVPLPEPDVVLLRGSVAGIDESHVFLAVSPHGSNGFVRMPGHQTFVISAGKGNNPIAANASVFDLTNLPEGAINWAEFSCEAENIPGNAQFDIAAMGVGGEQPSQSCRIVELAVETDWQFNQLLFGADEAAAEAYAITLIGAASDVYTEQVNTQLMIVFLRIWDTSNDPWDANGLSSQLSQFRDYWNANMQDVDRDLAHMLSGRGLGGGIAYIGGLCSVISWPYGFSGSLNGSFPMPLQDNVFQNWDPYVVCHELGHNFGTGHTHTYDPPIDGCGNNDCSMAADGTIMSYCHLCSGGTSNIALVFHPRVKNEAILPYLEFAATCVESSPAVNISEQPQAPDTVCVGEEVTFQVQATGAGDLFYQWHKNGSYIPSAPNAPVYTIPSVQLVNTGVYSVTVEDACGIVASETTQMTVGGGLLSGDVNCDAVVDVIDVLTVLSGWGACSEPCPPACPGDANDNCDVNVIDLLAVLNNWGPVGQ